MTTEEEARACYRIVSDPSWQVQVRYKNDWVTAWYCMSEESAKRMLEKSVACYVANAAMTRWGIHIMRCRDCGREEVVGDCIPEFCTACAALRDVAKKVPMPGRCGVCGAKLMTDGSCFDCFLFGRASSTKVEG